jgi:pyrophosphate--fructose-6-phosphate 1-phosphotransferase
MSALGYDPEKAAKPVRRVALMTAGGLAPCLSSAVGGLIQRYTEVAPWVEIIAYRGGYQGILRGDSFKIGRIERDAAHLLHQRGGSPIGNSRVKLTNVKDCVKRGLVKPGEDPLKVAADRLVRDRVDVLHTIGGDDTNTAAADLAEFLAANKYDLTVIGLPKTIDNDVYPIVKSLGAATAAAEGAKFFRNVAADSSSGRRTLIVHEVMGRNCGWLTAATAVEYMKLLDQEEFSLTFHLRKRTYDVHAVYVPELEINVEAEAARLRKVMDDVDNVNIFVSEGAGADAIAAQLRRDGKVVPVDAFGHIKLDAVNVGQWIADRLAPLLDADKVLVQKSGYYARAAKANAEDLQLIKSCCDQAVRAALFRQSGVVAHDEGHRGVLRSIEFKRIKGGKPLDVKAPWFLTLLRRIGQPPGAAVAAVPHATGVTPQPAAKSKL